MGKARSISALWSGSPNGSGSSGDGVRCVTGGGRGKTGWQVVRGERNNEHPSEVRVEQRVMSSKGRGGFLGSGEVVLKKKGLLTIRDGICPGSRLSR